MGAVYLAEHTLLGRRAAIKVLLSELSRNQEIVQRFFNEARAVTQIADPGIVQVFDFGYHTDGSAYLVMELLEGELASAHRRRSTRCGSCAWSARRCRPRTPKASSIAISSRRHLSRR
jgi:eukaryotic-like serine/threonine-protein kinase